MEKGKAERQEKRTEHIKERTQAKVEKKLKKVVRECGLGRVVGWVLLLMHCCCCCCCMWADSRRAVPCLLAVVCVYDGD